MRSVDSVVDPILYECGIIQDSAALPDMIRDFSRGGTNLVDQSTLLTKVYGGSGRIALTHSHKSPTASRSSRNP